jgi:hypothetical protein
MPGAWSPSAGPGTRGLAGGSASWTHLAVDARCEIWMRSAGPWAETLICGRVGLEPTKKIGAVFDQIIAEHGTCGGFHDWWEVTGYDPEVRDWWEAWLGALPRGALRSVTVLTPLRVLRMGITLANLKYRDITFHTTKDRSVYDRMRSEHMPGPRPPTPRRSDPR